MAVRIAAVVAVVAAVTFTSVLPAGAEVVDQDFEHDTWDESPGQTLAEAIDALKEAHPYDLVDVRGLDMTRTQRVRGYSGRGLEVVIPSGGFRGFGPYARFSERVDEAWFRYYVYLDGFLPVSSGKLPGPADASGTTSAKGCKPSTVDAPGWSARLMFDTVGTAGASTGEVPIGYYLYHLDQAGNCGDEHMFGVGLAQQRWTCIEGHVRMNTPGQNDGSIEAWVDSRHVFERTGLAFRRPGEDLGVREMWDNVYFGGSFPTPNHLRLVIDEVAISDTARPGCIDPFVDDNHSVHEGALTELYARQLLFGCREDRACPDDDLTRAEFATLMHRVVGAPGGPDAFSDDDGHWAEKSLDALAAAGLVRGCDPPANTRVCPDDPVTRAQVAVIVRRALSLEDGPDAFTDDDGHWAEAEINAVAASGITRGCAEDAFCPDRTMSRAEAATFMVRIDDRLRSVEVLSPLPDWPPDGPPPPKPVEERE